MSAARYGVAEYLAQQNAAAQKHDAATEEEEEQQQKSSTTSSSQKRTSFVELDIARIQLWSAYGFVYAAGPSFFLTNILYPRLAFFQAKPLATAYVVSMFVISS